jgi:hypothetical protein
MIRQRIFAGSADGQGRLMKRETGDRNQISEGNKNPKGGPRARR